MERQPIGHPAFTCYDCFEEAVALIDGKPACATHARIFTPNTDIFDVCQLCGSTWNPAEGDMTCPNPDCSEDHHEA